ncbi:MAG: RIP metalloprotease RseP [Candidatus Doudnabacteria bacterium]|nr:RIP metalloprotease RseP [Candidatus Doudnabacteria bacterium]
MILLAIIAFIFILGLLIFVHELGHFLMAKRAGMKVEEFGFGFPPRLFGIKRKGTLYSINWIPLGGFVKILGENAETSEPGSFSTKSALKRFLVLVAGVSMNAILAWLLVSLALSVGLPTQVAEGEQLPPSARAEAAQVALLYVEEGSPAQLAGWRAGDVVLSLDGREVKTIQELQDLTSANAGVSVVYKIQRGKSIFEKTIIPRTSPPAGQGPLGVQPALVAKISYPWFEAIYRGIGITGSLALQIILAFGRLIGSLFTDSTLVASLTGPVGIAVLTRDATELGFANLVYFTAILSINLAIINAIPFPALDGGRIFFLLIEKLRRKKFNARIENYVNTFGFFLLISLMVWITFKDFTRFGDQFGKIWGKITGL